MLEFHPVHKYLGPLLLAVTACGSDTVDSAAGDAGTVTVVGDGGTSEGVDASGETSDDSSSEDTVGPTVGHDTESTVSSPTSHTAPGSAMSSGVTDESDTSSVTDGHSDTSVSGTEVITSGTGATSGASSGSDTSSGTDTGASVTDAPVTDTTVVNDTALVTDTGAATDTTSATDTDVDDTVEDTNDTTSDPRTTSSSSDVATSSTDTSATTIDGGVTSGESATFTDSAPPDDTGTPGVMFQDDFDAEPIAGSGYTFNYAAFGEWTVIGGTVDLISFPNQLLASPGGYGDSQPADGVTVDLNGSNGHPGVMETQRSFTFHAGVTYQVTYSLGSPFAETNGVRVEVTDGVFSTEQAQVGIVPFAGYSATFTPDTTTTAKVRLTSLGGNDNVGLLFDAFSLERLP